ncbi:MAG: hypothetical protein IJO14_01125 [Clostridia bacterium]|nr:hypothetical protein [Clostridia bacterium]
MKEKKQSIGLRKSVVVAAAVLSILFTLGAVAYAATDGEIADTVVQTIDLIAGKVYVFVNGIKTEGELSVSEYVNEDGDTVFYVDVGVPLSDSDTEIRMEYVGDVEDLNAFDLYIQEGDETTTESGQTE